MASKYEENYFGGFGEFKDLLTCSLCLNIFKVPRHLPCLHNFCENCLSQVLSSAFNDCGEPNFKCPICWRPVFVDKRIHNSESLVRQFPLNHVLMNTIERQSNTVAVNFCNSCEVNGDKTEALSWCTSCEEALCKTCERCHRAFKISSAHCILSIHDMKVDETKFNIGGMIYCSEHIDKILEVYCIDHSKPCCCLCATLSHWKCSRVISIKDAAKCIKSSNTVKEIFDDLKEKIRKVNKLIKNREDCMDIFDKENDVAVKQVNETKEFLINHIHRISDVTLERLTASKKDIFVSLTDEVSDLSRYRAFLDNLHRLSIVCVEHGSDQQCLIEIEKIKSKYLEVKTEMQSVMSQSRKPSVTMEINDFIKNFIQNCKTFGNVSLDLLSTNASFGLPTRKFHMGNIEILRIVHINDDGFGSRQISGIFMDDTIIITDSVNKMILKYDEQYILRTRMKLPKEISDIARIDLNTVAVASSLCNDIFIINIANMSLIETVKTLSPVFGLVYVDSHFLTAYNDTLTWTTLSGHQIKQQNTKGDTWYVSASKTNSYIYADGTNSVSIVEDRGRTTSYNSKTLTNPRGIDSDFEGNIYICGFNSSNIHQISTTGELISDVSSINLGIERPWVIRFKPQSGIFLLTSYDKGKFAICQFK
ncbi:TRIM56 [Mytilus coruscus]|uniref:TRIM56 n=1 Tax=Mytilus coruscus TaxID=42192 RepID=A0A6J8CI04_MYTCO|nr:TRIM56 [Mytilus coruscus]